MNKASRNIELEKQIDRYVKGNLTEAESHKMWVELIKQPAYLPLLDAEIDLARFYRRTTTKKSSSTPNWKWLAAAAAVVLVVVGIGIFDSPSLKNYAIDEIGLSKNLATATVLRSDEPNAGGAEFLLNFGFVNATSGKTEEAMKSYKKVINQYPGTIFAAKAYLNAGILKYNSGRFEASVVSFEKALSIADAAAFLQEQAHWYTGNALIQIEKLHQARVALQQVYRLNGVHKAQAHALLKKLNSELNS